MYPVLLNIRRTFNETKSFFSRSGPGRSSSNFTIEDLTTFRICFSHRNSLKACTYCIGRTTFLFSYVDNIIIPDLLLYFLHIILYSLICKEHFKWCWGGDVTNTCRIQGGREKDQSNSCVCKNLIRSDAWQSHLIQFTSNCFSFLLSIIQFLSDKISP